MWPYLMFCMFYRPQINLYTAQVRVPKGHVSRNQWGGRQSEISKTKNRHPNGLRRLESVAYKVLSTLLTHTVNK